MELNKTEYHERNLFHFLIIVLSIIIIGSSIYKMYSNIKINRLLTTAENAYLAENFDVAIRNYKEYLTYDSSTAIKEKLNKTVALKNSKEIYSEAIELMEEEKYLSALDTFEKTDYDEESIEVFTAQCKSNYVNNEITEAKDLASIENYEEAISTLKNVSKFNENDLEVTELLSVYQNKYQVQKEAQTLAKKIYDERSIFLDKSNYNNYKVEVCIPYQEVYVYKNNDLVKTMTCSTGIESKPTPLGYYYLNGKGKYFFSKKYAQGGYYWMNFLNNIYLFHSVPVDYNKNIIEEEAQKLGEKASHGCIRLSMDDAKWLYDNVPSQNTLVYIH